MHKILRVQFFFFFLKIWYEKSLKRIILYYLFLNQFVRSLFHVVYQTSVAKMVYILVSPLISQIYLIHKPCLISTTSGKTLDHFSNLQKRFIQASLLHHFVTGCYKFHSILIILKFYYLIIFDIRNWHLTFNFFFLYLLLVDK